MTEKPSWANWIEDEDESHLVIGIECRSCKRAIYWEHRMAPDRTNSPWTSIVHGDYCKRVP